MHCLEISAALAGALCVFAWLAVSGAASIVLALEDCILQVVGRCFDSAIKNSIKITVGILFQLSYLRIYGVALRIGCLVSCQITFPVGSFPTDVTDGRRTNLVALPSKAVNTA